MNMPHVSSHNRRLLWHFAPALNFSFMFTSFRIWR